MVGGTYGRDRIVYKVKSGDVLGSIAMRHRVRVADLKKMEQPAQRRYSYRPAIEYLGQRQRI